MGLDIMQVAVSVCAASDEHSAGRGRHNANLWGPCSDHARIVQEVFALPEVAAALGDRQRLRERIAAADLHEPLVDHLGVYCGACDWLGGAGFVGHALSAALDRDAQGSQEASIGPASAGDAGDGRGHGRDDESGRGAGL